MVSFWPFKGDDNSPDSFERILSKLASQIQAETSKLALLRLQLRRYKGLWTIYTSFAYIFYVLVIFLVVGWKEVGPPQIAGLVGGPIGIWGVRSLLMLYYNGRISTTETKLEDLQTKQRDTVEKLKAATKFSTTQSIIEKYGGGPISPSISEIERNKMQHAQQQGPPGHPNNNQQLRQRPQGQPSGASSSVPPSPQQIQQQFAQQQLQQQQQERGQQHLAPPSGVNNPNPVKKFNRPSPIPVLSFSQATVQAPARQIAPEEIHSPRWYDRVLDVLVGEDETSAKNRFALICKNCRMVNGLAPPGTKNLEDVEGWGCARCGMMNGKPPSRPLSRKGDEEEMDIIHGLGVRGSRISKSSSPTPSESVSVRSTRSRTKKASPEPEPEPELELSEEDSSAATGSDQVEDEEAEEVEEAPKPKGRVTRGSKKA